MSMRNDAVDVLNKAGISIDVVKTEYNLEGKNHIKYETVQARTEEHTDEWHAARVLLHVRQTNIKKNVMLSQRSGMQLKPLITI